MSVDRERYLGLTPLELNTNLFYLYSRFPLSSRAIIEETPIPLPPDSAIGFKIFTNTEVSSGEKEDEIRREAMAVLSSHFQEKEIMRRRRSSEVKAIFLEDFAALTFHSPATFSFITYATDVFNKDYDGGINRDDLSRNSFYWILDRDLPNSGGIFDLGRLEILELQGYNKLLDEFLDNQYTQTMVERFKQGILPQEPFPPFTTRRFEAAKKFGVLRNHGISFIEKLLPVWRIEILQKYGVSV